MGRARAIIVSSPPHMIVRTPFIAPETPPLTGASTNPTPRSESRAAMRRDVAGSPDVQSTSVAPRSNASSMPSFPSSRASTSREVGRHVITTAAPATASAVELAASAFVSRANSVARDAVRFQTDSS
jgi:hypothetical protein